MHKKKIFVTGATGFIGSNLITKLHVPENDITIFVPKDSTHPFLKGLKITRIDGDIRDYDTLLKSIKGHDYVYHLAALSISDEERRDELFSVNVNGTENVMKACLESGVKKVVHIGTVAVLGFSRNESVKLTEKNVMDFKDYLYGQSKKLGIDKVHGYVKKGLNATIVHPCSVNGIGEIEPSGLIKSIMRGSIKFTFPGGTSFVAVEDITDGIILAMEKGKKDEEYILSTDYMKFKDMYNKIASVVSAPKIKFELPKFTYYPMYFLGALLEKLLNKPPITREMIRWSYNYRNCDSTKARRELGWKPKVTFEEAIKRTVDYYREYHMI